MNVLITCGRSHLQIFILYSLFFCLEGCSLGNGPILGNTTSDYELEVGSTLVLNCTITNHEMLSGSNSSNILFTFGNNTVSQSLVFLLDSHTAQLRIPNAQVQHSGKYMCNVKQENGDAFLICLTQVLVGYKPQPVNKFGCISESFQNLTCCWTPSYNPVVTTYKLYNMWYAMLPHYTGILQLCPEQVNKTCCQWRMDTLPSYKRDQTDLYFNLTSVNIFGSLVEIFNHSHFQIVLPDAPLNLKVANKSQTEINITWIPPKGFQYEQFLPGLHYQLWYRNKNSQDEWKIREVGIDKTGYILRGLIPYIHYEIRVRCRSSKADLVSGNMWSVFNTISCRTPSDVPYLNPVIRKEAFQQTVHKERNITLYWKPVPKEHYNGEDFHYVIECHMNYKSHSKQTHLVKRVRVGNFLTSYTFDHLAVKTPYRFIFYSVNREGQSDNSSGIIVNSVENIIPGPVNITVVFNVNGTYEIEWGYPTEEVHITNFTVFWCNGPRPFLCSHPINWKTIPADINRTEFGFEKVLNYQFAVAANSEKLTSGMVWALCVVSTEKALNKVSIVVQPYSESSLIVKWTLSCEAEKKVINNYIVYYCRSTSNHTCLEPYELVKVNNPYAEEMILSSGLQPFTTYSVKVQTETLYGLLSEFSYTELATTEMGTPTEPLNLHGTTNSTAISLSWKRPERPNGILDHYIVWLNEHTIKVDHCMESWFCSIVLDENIKSFTNYSVSVQACNKNLCSKNSSIFYAMIDIRAPGMMNEPVIEILNTSTVYLRWVPPDEPNGPIDLYILYVSTGNTTDTGNKVYNISNISGSETSTYFWPDCGESDSSKVFTFRIQAVNIKNQSLLKSPLSNEIESRLCGPKGPEAILVIGIVGGSCLGLILLVFVLYAVVRWMKKKVDWMNKIKVQLPSGLDAPHPNTFSDCQKLKKGLIRSDSYPNKSPIFDHIGLFSDVAGFTERQGSLNSHCSSSSTDELLQKKTGLCDTYRTKHKNKTDLTLQDDHESIINHTHLSSDSGTEIDILPPISLRRDPSEVTDKMLLSCSQPSLPNSEEIQYADSRDSGLDHDHIDDKRKGFHHSQSGVQQPYSRFSQDTGYTSFPNQNSNLTLSRHLTVSEPSVHGEEEEVQVIPYYLRFGLAKSVGNIIEENRNPPLILDEDHPGAVSYSKFGVMHPMNQGRERNQTASLVSDYSKSFPVSQRNPWSYASSPNQPVSKGYVSVTQVKNFTVPNDMEKPNNSGLYLKFGVDPEVPESFPASSGYVCVQSNFSSQSLPEIDKGTRFGLDMVLEFDDKSPNLKITGNDESLLKPSTNCLDCETTESIPPENSNDNDIKSSTPLLDEDNLSSKNNMEQLSGIFSAEGYIQCNIPQYSGVNEHVEELDSETPDWMRTLNETTNTVGTSNVHEKNSDYVPHFHPHHLPSEVPLKNFSDNSRNNGYVPWGDSVKNKCDEKDNSTELVVGVDDGIKETTTFCDLMI
ncbi:uncharacterized protein LOC143249623 [Tachypleus tridentatus]|uniref:uncharacterized protein LOC143249623 n=1 Tax=Tachypleus tridentatus TaxID=6853 RepID=UPI003FD053C5